MSVRSLDNGVLSDRQQPAEQDAFCLWSGVAHGRASKTESRLHSHHRLRAGRVGRGAGCLRTTRPRRRDPPRSLVGERARQAGARPARCLAHPGAVAAVARKRAASGGPRLVLASVFPYSAQNYMLRLWLSSGGLDPDRDVRLTIVPPPHTVAHLSGGVIDGYCVGEPWNQRAAVLGIGRIALTGPVICKGMPEKVLGTTE